MSFTSTTNYALQKPGIGTEIDAWGDDINTNFDLIDTRMKLNADAAAAASTLAGTKSAIGHTHVTSEVTGLDAALTGKAPTSHTHTVSQITDMPSLAGYAPLASPTFTGTPAAPTAAALTNTTQLATTAFVTAAVAAVTGGGGGIVNKTATSTLLLTDAGNLVEMSVASANTLTIPPNSSVAFPVNTEIDIVQMGAGQTTLLAGAGVTLRASGAKLKLTAQYSGATIKKRGTDDWYVWGDLSA
jgi:hypothetical protein